MLQLADWMAVSSSRSSLERSSVCLRSSGTDTVLWIFTSDRVPRTTVRLAASIRLWSRETFCCSTSRRASSSVRVFPSFFRLALVRLILAIRVSSSSVTWVSSESRTAGSSAGCSPSWTRAQAVRRLRSCYRSF